MGKVRSGFVCKTLKRKDGLVAKIVIHSEVDKLDYYIVVERPDKAHFKLWIYSEEPVPVHFPDLFPKMRWKGENELVVIPPSKEVQISVFINEGKALVRQARRYVAIKGARVI